MKLNPYFRTFMRLLWFQESWNGNIFFVENSERIRYRNIRITVVPKSFKCKYFSTRLHAQYESISESQNIPIHPWYTRQFSCHRDRGRRGAETKAILGSVTGRLWIFPETRMASDWCRRDPWPLLSPATKGI